MSVVDVIPSSPPTTTLRQSCATLKFPTAHTSTPEDSPASFPGSSSLGSRKRVEFRGLTNIHSTISPLSPNLSSTVKPLPPSRDCQPNSKSILKIKVEDDGRSYSFDGPADEKAPFNETMDSIIQQLTRNDKLDSVDAYQTLASAIKAYDEIPEEAVLKNKIHVLLKYVRRDLAVLDKSEVQPSDSNLLTQALKVAVILVWSEMFSTLLPDEFRLFILDRAIQTIIDHSAPKIVIVHYLHLLATQNFRPGLIVSNNRVSRLLEGLRALTNYVKGNGAVSERLLVYQKLMDQARPTMKSKAQCWVGEMLTSMASTISDTRNKALCLGRKACQAFPASASISHPVRQALQQELEGGKTLGSVLCRKFEKMLLTKDEPASVPQLWAVVLLLSNSLETRFATMPDMKEWLKVIQKCFNSSDSTVRQQANLAWNRFVYIVRPHSASMDIMSMLAKPVTAQMDRCGTDKASKHSQAAAISSYCNLLYYAFRAAATPEQYTRAWNEYVVKVMRTSFFEKNSANADIAARILMAMFWDSRTSTKLWNENRAHENSFVEPEELPVINCKWTRSKHAPILEIFRILFKYCSWGLSAAADQAYISKAWRHFLKAIHEPAKREVKQAKEEDDAIEGILKLLSDYHRSNPTQVPSAPASLTLLPRDVVSRITRIFFAETNFHQVIDVVIGHSEIRTEILAEAFHYADALMLRKNGSTTKTFDPALAGAVPKIIHALDMRLSQLYRSTGETEFGNVMEALKTLTMLLSITDAPTFEMVVLNISKGVAIWLQDNREVVHKKGTSLDVIPGSSLEMLTGLCEQILRNIQTEAIPLFDDVLDAIFNSAHPAVIESATMLWSKRFAMEEVNLGPLLSKTFSQQKKFLESSFSVDRINDENEPPQLPQSPFTFQTQAEEEYVTDPFEPSCDDHDISDMIGLPRTNGMQHDTLQSAAAPTWDSSPVTKARARHDDSQIVFTTVEALPVPIDELESQCLTDRQKNVRNRQRIEPAVVFPDLRSSPRAHSRPASRNSEPTDTEFARKMASTLERPSTPVLENSNDLENGELVPSPTPKARHSINRLADPEVPSSPPSVFDTAEQRHCAQEQISSPLLGARDIVDDVVMQEQQQVGDIDFAHDDTGPFTAAEISDDEELHRSSQHLYENRGVDGDRSPEVRMLFPTHQRASGIAESEHEQEDAPTDKNEHIKTISEIPLPELGPYQANDTSDGLVRHPDPRTLSDEMNEMSASQLSQDLEMHIENEVQDIAIPVSVEHEESAIHLEKGGEKCRHEKPMAKKRKRNDKESNVNHTRLQRRKTLSDAESEDGSQFSTQQLEEVIDSQQSKSSPPQVSSGHISNTETPSTAVTLVPARTRSQTRRSGQLSQTGIQFVSKKLVPNPKADPSDSMVHAQTLAAESEKTGDEYETAERFTKEVTALSTVDEANEVNSESAVATDLPQLPHQEPQAEKSESSLPLDIMQSLQAVLDHMRNGTVGPFDLRAIDELCFQIRFQAQIAPLPPSQ